MFFLNFAIFNKSQKFEATFHTFSSVSPWTSSSFFMLFFSVFEVVGFAANISRAEICPFFDLELDALTLLKKRGTFTLKS